MIFKFVFVIVMIAFSNGFPHSKKLGREEKIADASCKKKYFIKSFVNKGKTLTDSEYHNLQSCPKYYKRCKDYAGTISVTYAENNDGQYLIVFDAYELQKQGCWGFALQQTDDLETKTFYFGFNKKTNSKAYQKLVFIRLGFHYNFTLTALPTGKPSSLITKSPNVCELEIIDSIYYKIKEKKIFADCTEPDYNTRRKTAEKLCKLYPKDQSKRLQVARDNLTEENCKFVLLPDNAVSLMKH